MTPSEPQTRATPLEDGQVDAAGSGLAPPPESGGEPDPDAGERRLHPLSWLFVLLAQLRHAVFPLILLVFIGGGDEESFALVIAAIGAMLLAVYSVIWSFGFRYRIGATDLVVREGIFDRTERHVPFVRIQNVSQRRNPLHRLFGVAELRLESAGGTEPEARMSVITVAEAEVIERLLKARRHASENGDNADGLETAVASERLLVLPLAEVVRLGIISNRGMVAVAALLGVVYQTGRDPRDLVIVREIWSPVERLLGERFAGAGPAEFVASASILLLLAFALLRVLSIAIAILRHYGFTLESDGSRVGTEEGLLTRVRAGAALDRIQRLVVEESLLMRWFGRRAARVDVAGSAVAINEPSGTRFRWVAPIARPEAIGAIVARIAPTLSIEREHWQPLHPNAWRRLVVVPSVLLVALALIGLAAVVGPLSQTFLQHWPWELVAVGWPLLMVLVWLHAFGWARFSRYALDEHTLVFREGWLSRRWSAIELARIQGVIVWRSPADRWNEMATLIVEVAGTAATEHSIEIPFLPADVAEQLAVVLRRRVQRDRQSMQWPEPRPGADAARMPLDAMG
jgi:putative membrane protein